MFIGATLQEFSVYVQKPGIVGMYRLTLTIDAHDIPVSYACVSISKFTLNCMKQASVHPAISSKLMTRKEDIVHKTWPQVHSDEGTNKRLRLKRPCVSTEQCDTYKVLSDSSPSNNPAGSVVTPLSCNSLQ